MSSISWSSEIPESRGKTQTSTDLWIVRVAFANALFGSGGSLWLLGPQSLVGWVHLLWSYMSKGSHAKSSLFCTFPLPLPSTWNVARQETSHYLEKPNSVCYVHGWLPLCAVTSVISCWLNCMPVTQRWVLQKGAY